MNIHGKKPSPYDMTPQEIFYAELGREISDYADNHKTKSLRFICYLHVINLLGLVLYGGHKIYLV